VVGVITVSESWLWRRIRADQDVYNPDEFCEGLGCRVPPPGRHEHAVLDRDPPHRPTPVARQSPLTDGISARSHFFRIVAVDQHLDILKLTSRRPTKMICVCETADDGGLIFSVGFLSAKICFCQT